MKNNYISKTIKQLHNFKAYFVIKQTGVCVYRKIFPASFILDRLKISSWAAAILIWFFYYVGVLIFNIFNGTAFTKEVVNWINNHAILSPLTSSIFWVKAGYPELRAVILDSTHTVWSFFLTPIGVIIGYYFLKAVNNTFSNICELGVVKIPEKRIKKCTNEIQSRFNKPIYTVIAVFLGILMFGTFIYMAHRNDLKYWWGHCQYGYSGYYLGFAMGFITYAAIYVLFIMWETILSIKYLMSYPIVPRPFHPDKCGGFSQIGKIIFLLYALVAWAGVAIFTVYTMGYFNLENTLTFFLVITIYTIVSPILWLTPTMFVVNKLRYEKTKLLHSLESNLHKDYEHVREQILIDPMQRNIDISLEKIERAKKIFSLIDDMPIWPFNVQRIRTIVVGNIIQIGAFIMTLFSFMQE